MQGDEQDGLEPDEELELPEEDEPKQRRREKQTVDLPERTRGSPLLRRVIVGELQQKGRKSGSEANQEERAKRRRARRGSKSIGRVADVTEPDEDLEEPIESPEPVRRSPAEARPDSPVKAAAAGEAATGEAATGEKELSEVFTRTASGGADEPAPQVERRRRRQVRFDQEAEWEKGRRSSSWWLGAGLLCVLVVGLSVFVVIRRGDVGTSEPVSNDRAPEESSVAYDTLPIAEFVARSVELLPIVREVLIASESGEGGAELLRGGEESLRRREVWRKRYPQPAPFREEGLHEIHASGNDRFAYLVMTGEREDFSRVEAYFVKGEGKEGQTATGRMLLDWEATEGYSEVLVDELEILSDGKPRMMRAHISLSNFYTDVYPEQKYRCYTLHHDDPGEWIWAYAERNGEVDFRLLNHMRTRDPLGRARKVTVRIAEPLEGARANQVEIREFLFGGWIEQPPREAGGEEPDDGETLES